MKKKFSMFHLKFLETEGFTLIELLVVMSIFVIVGGLIISVLFVSLRGSNKSETIAVVKQNGTYALSQMVKQIRFAKALNSPATCIPSTTAPSITITSVNDDGQTTFSCPNNLTSPLTSNSAALVDAGAVAVTYCSFTCSQANLSEPPRVTIQFTLSTQNSGSLVETQSSIPFQSSVIMRNAVQ